MIVTIDGPTASGKSTIARRLAEELGFYYLPTGWFYRAVAFLLVERCNYTEEMLANPTPEDVEFCLDPARLVYTYDVDRGGKIFFEKKDITSFLKDYTVDRYVAIISPIVMVREKVVEAQRSFAKTHDCVIEGRDTGSVVFPHANYKFYLTASLAVRAKRWQKDQKKRGNEFTQVQAEKEVSERDHKDIKRKHSPLTIPENAIEIDDSQIDLEQTVQTMMNYLRQ